MLQSHKQPWGDCYPVRSCSLRRNSTSKYACLLQIAGKAQMYSDVMTWLSTNKPHLRRFTSCTNCTITDPESELGSCWWKEGIWKYLPHYFSCFSPSQGLLLFSPLPHSALSTVFVHMEGRVLFSSPSIFSVTSLSDPGITLQLAWNTTIAQQRKSASSDTIFVCLFINHYLTRHA